MRRKKERVQVEVGEETIGEQRAITITVTGTATDFLFADQLAQRKIIEPVTTVFKKFAQDATSGYLQKAEEVIAKVISDTRQEISAKTSGVKRRGRKKRTEATEPAIAVESVAPKMINGAVTTPGHSGSQNVDPSSRMEKRNT
ncbi:MAG TPA: hypothetical protein VJ302_16360 [Blastocatellia bacterium]|nr:hypothetical protein [Blastocatellia bacterium]